MQLISEIQLTEFILFWAMNIELSSRKTITYNINLRNFEEEESDGEKIYNPSQSDSKMLNVCNMYYRMLKSKFLCYPLKLYTP